MADPQIGIHADLERLYKSILPKPPTTISFFDRGGEFYTIIGQDAVFVSKEILHRSSSELKTSSNDSLEYVNVNKVQFEVLVKDLLLVHLYRVEVYDMKTRSITYKASPGNVSQFEDILFSGSADNSHSFGVAALAISTSDNAIQVGLAMADQTTRELKLAEFADNDRYSNLEAALVQFNAKEILVKSGEATPRAVRDVLQHTGALITDRKKSEFSSKNTSQDLERLLKRRAEVTVDALPEMDKKLAVSCLGLLISYLEFMSDSANFGKYRLTTFDLTQFMKLDCAAVKALNLMPSTSDSKEMCVYRLLNQCKTSPGQRLLKLWIVQPLIDINKIEERLNLVEVFFTDCVLRQSIHEEHLVSLPDFLKLAKKLSMGKANLQDCYKIYQGLARLPHIDHVLDQYDGVHRELLRSVYVAELKELMLDLSKYSSLIEEVLDMDSVDSTEFLIKPDFDEGLAELGERMKDLESKMSKELSKAASELKLEAGKSIKLDTNSQLGHFLRLSRKEEKVLRNNKNYETLDTKKDGVRFTSRTLSKHNAEHMEVKRSYQNLQSDVVTEIMKVASGYAEPLYRLGDLLASLDVIVSLAVASANAPVPYVRPQVLAKGSAQTELVEVRHPCLEVIDVDVIPNDCTFDKHKSMFHIITGPNMGGKSTYIRTVALSVLMAQMGCFVPCKSAKVTIVDSIMARVGAGDSQLKGISTFMAEMLESSAIIKSATSDSLIVIDELGRGTATYDGFGLAWGISHYIATKIGCFTLFATHFHELTTLADQLDHVTNVHVSALTDGGQMTLLYKVLPGVCDESFGLHVANMVKFPERVLESAKKKAMQLEDVGSTFSGGEQGQDEKLKRKRERDESHPIIVDYVKRIKAMPTDSPDLLEKIAVIHDEMQRHDNSYIRNLASV